MNRRRITQIFPWLLPIRKKQRLFWFYTKMKLDGNHYAQTIYETEFPYLLFKTSSPLYNRETGFDMTYQENKVFNLKLAAAALNKLVITPQETFSFCNLVRHADRYTPYKDGLTVIDGKLTTAPGGGMCQMSNLLFWMFLHSPLTVVERHTHKVKDFPAMRDTEPEGVDATISEGWIDLKIKNETDMTFQIGIAFDDAHIIGSLFTDKDSPFIYEIKGRDLSYFREDGRIYEEISIFRQEIAADTRVILHERPLYKNLCEIGYRLPDNTQIVERREK